MTVKYKDKDLELHYCHRIYVIFENLMSQEDEDISPNSQTAQTKLVYAALQASLKYHKIDDVVTYDELENFIDDNGNMVFMAKFNEWFTQCAEAETELVRKISAPTEEKKVQS